MKSIPVIKASHKTPLRSKRRLSVQQKEIAGTSMRDSDLGELLHDIANQLTLLSLASFELHTTTSDEWQQRQADAVRSITMAAEEATKLFRILSEQLDRAPKRKRRERTKAAEERHTKPANVYPISPYLNRR